MKKIIILIFLSFLITGCTDYKELDDLAIVEAMGIEKKDNEYFVTSQIINTSTLKKNSNTTESKTFIYTGCGKTIFEAIRNISNKSSKKLYYPHLKVLLIDKSVLSSIKSILDLVTRDTESMMSFDVVVTTDYTPNEILKTISPLVSSSAEGISKIIEISEQNNGNTYVLKFEDLLKDLVSYGVTPVFTSITLNKNLKEKDKMELLNSSEIISFIEALNLVSYKKDGTIIKLDNNESIGINFVKNKIKYSLITLPCEDKSYSMEMFSSSTKMKDDLKNNNIIINIKSTLAIGEFNCNLDINSEKTITMIKKDTENMIKEYINKAFKLAQKEETDFLGIGNFIYKNNPKYFNFQTKNWHKDGLKKITLTIKPNVNIIKQGNLKRTIKDNNYEK